MDRILTIKKPYSLKAVSPLDLLLIKNFLWDFFFFPKLKNKWLKKKKVQIKLTENCKKEKKPK